jgi:glutathione S-transferase
MPTAHLYGMAYSPWTERARWALDYHRVAYRYHEHVPLLGEPLLRFRARHTGRAKVSVPLFIDASGSYGDSLDIIKHADQLAATHPLVHDSAVTQRWAERLEPVLNTMRARMSVAILGDPAAAREAASGAVPDFLAGALRPVTARVARFLAGKYGYSVSPEASDLDTPRRVFTSLREELAGREHLIGDALTAVDILAATSLQGVTPVSDKYIALKPATRRAWHSEPLAHEFADLIAWRDRLYDRYRRG